MKNVFSFIVLILFTTFAFGQGHWEKISQPTDKVLKHVFFIDSLTGWCAGSNGVIFHTTDGSATWIEQNSTVTTFIVDLFFLNKNLGWALTYRNAPPFGSTILSTTNGGNEWIANDYPEDNVFMNAVFYFDSLNGWLGGSKITSTTDGGSTWQDASIDSSLVSGLPVLNFNFLSRQFGFACGGFLDLAGVIWRTTDFGENWSATGISPDEVFDMYVFDSLNAITLSGDPEGFYGIGDIKSYDGGDSWSYTELPLQALSFTIDFRTSTEGWSASGFKFLFTLDSGNTWQIKETPDSTVVFDLMFTDINHGYAVGQDGVVLRYIPPPVSVNDDVFALLEDFDLFQNYPNPFNPTTRIQYTVSNRQFITIKVYDVIGNEVAILVNEEKHAGTYEIEFSIKDATYALTSGIYFYQIHAGNIVKTKKMVLIK